MDLYLEKETIGLQLWPRELRAGDRLLIAFVAPRFAGGGEADHHEVVLTDGKRRVATIARGRLQRSGGVICVEWGGDDDWGRPVPAGSYRVVVTRPMSRFRLERTLMIET